MEKETATALPTQTERMSGSGVLGPVTGKIN